MQFQATVRQAGSRYTARTYSNLTGEVIVVGESSDEAIEKLRGEIRYRLEYCPCTSTEDDEVQITVQSEL